MNHGRTLEINQTLCNTKLLALDYINPEGRRRVLERKPVALAYTLYMSDLFVLKHPFNKYK